MIPGCDSLAGNSRKTESVNVKGELARASLTRAILANVATSLDLFKLDHDRYPDMLDDLIVAPKYVKTEKYPPKGYLREIPVDSWNHNHAYKRGGSTAIPYELMSYGSDGRPGGEGFDADITY